MADIQPYFDTYSFGMVKWGKKAPFWGKTPNFWGFLSFFTSDLVSTCQMLSFDMHIVWIGECWFLPIFLFFLLYQRPPDFVVFGVLWTPYRKWWALIRIIFYLTRFLIIWALVDRNWMISLGCTVVLVQPWPRITFCQKGPKKGGFWGATPTFEMTWWCDPQKALPYARTRRLSHQPSKLVQRFGL